MDYKCYESGARLCRGSGDRSLPVESKGEAPVRGLGDELWQNPQKLKHFCIYSRIHFAPTWKDITPLKSFQFEELKAAVYAFQQR